MPRRSGPLPTHRPVNAAFGPAPCFRPSNLRRLKIHGLASASGANRYRGAAERIGRNSERYPTAERDSTDRHAVEPLMLRQSRDLLGTGPAETQDRRERTAADARFPLLSLLHSAGRPDHVEKTVRPAADSTFLDHRAKPFLELFHRDRSEERRV